jgi:adenylate cyclase
LSTRFQLGGYQRQRLVRSLAAGLVTALCGLALILTPILTPLGTTFERFERKGLDQLFKWRGSRPQPPDVVMIEINNDTGKDLSQDGWLVCPDPSATQKECDNMLMEPADWPTVTVHAHLIERLVEENARGIVFDVYFDRPKPGDEDLEKAIKQADRVILVDWLEGGIKPSISKGGVDIGPFPFEQIKRPTEKVLESAKALAPWLLEKPDPKTFGFWTFKSGDMPTTAAVALQLKALDVYEDWLAILNAALDAAHAPRVEHLPARAQEVRSPRDMLQLMLTFRSVFQQNDWLHQQVVQEIARFYSANSDATSRQLTTALAALYAGPDSYYINFYGPPGTIRNVPYQSYFKKDGIAGSGDLSNTMVFVGRSDRTHFQVGKVGEDTFATSFTKQGIDLSGVEIMATAYANLLSGRMLTQSPPATSALVVVAFGLLVGVLAYLLPATAAVPAVIVFTILYWLSLQWRFNVADVWLPLATPALVQLPIALLIGLMGQYLLKRRKEEQMTRAIRYYLPESLVRDLTQRQVDPTTLNRVVFGTCLATDMSDFITLAESKSPHELAVFMNEYFDALAQALKRHGVDVMEFRADMIMCAWIAPVRSPDVCRKGMNAAIEVSEIITRFAQAHGSRHFNPRVGLQDGDVYVGHTGGGGRFLYSIVGDTANTAARLESLNKHLGTHVLAAESVVRDSDGLLLRPLGAFRLRGKTDPTSVFEILGRKESARSEHLDLCAQFAEGLAAFQRKEWLRAASVFESITERFVDDGPSRFYWAYSQKYAVESPIYDGPAVIHMHEK